MTQALKDAIKNAGPEIYIEVPHGLGKPSTPNTKEWRKEKPQ